jgi:hypothetical protein
MSNGVSAALFLSALDDKSNIWYLISVATRRLYGDALVGGNFNIGGLRLFGQSLRTEKPEEYLLVDRWRSRSQCSHSSLALHHWRSVTQHESIPTVTTDSTSDSRAPS